MERGGSEDQKPGGVWGGGIQAGQWGEELKSADIPLGWTFSRKTL